MHIRVDKNLAGCSGSKDGGEWVILNVKVGNK